MKLLRTLRNGSVGAHSSSARAVLRKPPSGTWQLAVGFVLQVLALVSLSRTALANSVPHINLPLVPASTAPGGKSFTLTVNGTGFVSGSVVKWNGASRTTHFVSDTQLTATIRASDIVTPQTALITVLNPTPGGGRSNAVYFQVTGATSSLSLNRTDFATGAGPHSVAAADFNKDGKPDLAIINATDDTVSILLGNGDGTFQTQVAYATGSGPLSVAVADFNRDGRQDLVVTNDYADTVSILLGNGDGTFKAHVDYATGISPTSVSIGDFNGDGILDLAVTNFNADTVSILLGNRNGTFQPHTDYPTGPAPFSVVVGDFNRDGKLDLAVANYNSGYDTGSVSILLGNGDGTFQAHVDYATANNPTSVIAADFNGDGKPDLALTSETGNTVSILLGNGDGTFGTHVDYPVGTTPVSLTTADFNGDGRLDLAVANNGSATVSILLGNGDGTFQASVDSQTGFPCISVAAADFNSDGALDLALAQYTDDTVSVMMQVPVASLSADSLSFGNQAVGTTSPSQNVTLSNTGSGLLTISGITITGDTADFAQTNTCGTFVLGGASCTISVTFTPTQEGTRTGSVNISDNVNSQHIVSLSGTGLAPLVSWSPSSLTFAGQTVNTTSPAQTVTLTNTGNAALSITSIGTSGDFAETNTCPASLAAGSSCAVSVTFTPTKVGTRTGDVTITSNASQNPKVSLTGTGLGPIVSWSPSSLTFASQLVGTTSPAQSVTLTNTGNASMSITSIGTTGDYAATNNCGTTLAAGASCTVKVTFTPERTGTRTGTVTITSNAPSNPKVSLTGTGVAPAVSLSPTSLTFGSQAVGSTSPPQQVTLTNTGTYALTIDGIATTGDFAQTNTCPASLAAGSSCTVSVTFKPTKTGTRTGTLSFTDNAPGSPQKVSLSGTGT